MNCPTASIFKQANLTKNDGNLNGWYTFQTSPKAVKGWTIGFSSTSPDTIKKIDIANRILETDNLTSLTNNGIYCTYYDTSHPKKQYTFWATKNNGPSAA